MFLNKGEEAYPVKYALAFVNVPLNPYEYLPRRINSFKACIPLPCYLMSEIKRYTDKENFLLEYEVFFIYSPVQLSSCHKLVRDEPLYSYKQRQRCGEYEMSLDNSDIVPEVYDDYESARENALKLNEELIASGVVSFSIEKINEEYDKRLGLLYEIVEFIEKNISLNNSPQKKLK